LTHFHNLRAIKDIDLKMFKLAYKLAKTFK